MCSEVAIHVCDNKYNNFNTNKRTNIYKNCVNSERKGEVSIKVSNYRFNNVKLKYIMFIPDFKSNLLSMSSITQYRYKVIFHKDYAVIRHSNGSVAMKAEMRDELYFSSINENSKFAG